MVATQLKLGIVAVFLTAIPGCTTPVPEPVQVAVDPDDVPISEADVDIPKTYRDAVDRLISYRDQIRDAISEGTPGKAHRPLDELDVVAWKMPEIARDSGVPRRHWETVVVSSEALTELFGRVHSAIDDHKEPDYDAVARPIDDAIAALQSVIPDE
jgi:hypothetical protein